MAAPALRSAPDAAPRTRVLRSAPDEVPWELWERTPHPALAGLVAGLWAGVSPERGTRHRTLPNGELLLMLHLGPTQRLRERDGVPCRERLGGSFLAGLQERPATFECCDAFTCVAAVRLSPAGGFALCRGLPQQELVGRVLEAEAVLGGGASGLGALRQRMGEAADLGEALDHLEAWLLARLAGAAAPADAIRASLTHLADRAGALRIDALARSAGVSPRRLHELFRREVGVSAKRLARILRFRRALERLATAPRVDLALLALECGYADQSHLYRDFRALATLTPRAYLAALGDGLDGPDVLASGGPEPAEGA